MNMRPLNQLVAAFGLMALTVSAVYAENLKGAEIKELLSDTTLTGTTSRG